MTEDLVSFKDIRDNLEICLAIPFRVIFELVRLEKRGDEIGRRAQQTTTLLRDLASGKHYRQHALHYVATLHYFQTILDRELGDTLIVEYAHELSKATPLKVAVITQDKNVGGKYKHYGLYQTSASYYKFKLDPLPHTNPVSN